MNPVADIPAPDRSCGTCTACCKVLAVHAVFKPKAVWCIACDVGKGCTIYETRPPECANYACAWLAGFFRAEDRPDQSGVIVGIEATTDGKVAFTMREYRDGAADRSYWQNVLAQQLGNGKVDKIAVFDPRGVIRRAWTRRGTEFVRAFWAEGKDI
jgi:coenzyme F420-reducing hydrogenase beta subunit